MTDVVRKLEREADEYAHGEDRPLAAYSGIVGVYLVVVGAIGLLARSRKAKVSVSWADVALAGVATHKLTRILSKEPIASPLRAPFTRYEGVSGPAELKEEVRGTGWRKAMGELVTCPFCLGSWTSTAMISGMIFFPRATRAAAAIFATLGISDSLQLVYTWLERKAEGA